LNKELIKHRIRNVWYLRGLLVLSNWLFQGILGSDSTERLYKLLFTALLSVVFFLIYSAYLNLWTSVLTSLLTAHTLNWIINSNFSMLLIHRLYIGKLCKENLFTYLSKLKERLMNKAWILYVASYGSICRGELKDSSDVDISFVRKGGFKNAINALIFILKEKKKADLLGIPLEITLSDSPENSIIRFKKENTPISLYDPKNILDNYYDETLTLEEAKQQNLYGKQKNSPDY